MPLWLAILLKRQRRARVIPPDWLNVESLKNLLEQEEKEEPFAPLPFLWLEVSTALLNRLSSMLLYSSFSASDDMIEPDVIRRLLRDLRELRMAKARKGIDALGDTYVQMDNLGRMEVNEMRFLSHAADRLRTLASNSVEYEADV